MDGGRLGCRCACLWRDDLGEKMKITLPGITTLPQWRPLLPLRLSDLGRIQWFLFFWFPFSTAEEMVSHVSWSLHIPVFFSPRSCHLAEHFKEPAACGGQISGFSESAATLWCFCPGAELSRLLNRESQGFVHSG